MIFRMHNYHIVSITFKIIKPISIHDKNITYLKIFYKFEMDLLNKYFFVYLPSIFWANFIDINITEIKIMNEFLSRKWKNSFKEMF